MSPILNTGWTGKKPSQLSSPSLFPRRPYWDSRRAPQTGVRGDKTRTAKIDDCDAPHINVILIEDAVETHYAAIGFSPAFIETVRAHIVEAIGEQEAAAYLLHRQLTSELRPLDTREDNLIHLAADGTVSKPRSGQSCARSNTNAATSPSA